MEAHIVIDLGFGDSGKGLCTDYLVRSRSAIINDSTLARETTVVRFSGGQQAGHTVVTDNHRHVFANYGSGSLAGAASYFSEHCTFYPPNILRERSSLLAKGGNTLLGIHPLCNLTTPWDIAYNRITETERSKLEGNAHGSCGLGINATITRNESPYKLYAIDLLYPDLFEQKLKGIEYYYGKLISNQIGIMNLSRYMSDNISQFIFDCKEIIDKNYIHIEGYEYLRHNQVLVFEGSQGIMLDQSHGVFPNVTRANTTSKNAMEILCHPDIKPLVRDIDIHYVTRCYQTRHGNGWMNGENETLVYHDDTNIENNWQGSIRFAPLYLDQLEYALRLDKVYHKSDINPVKHLLFTHLDQEPDFPVATFMTYLQNKHLVSLGKASHGPKANDIMFLHPITFKTNFHESIIS